MKTVVALYTNSTKARDTVGDLRDLGIPGEEISVVANNKDGQFARMVEDPTLEDIAAVEGREEDGSGAAEGAGIGAVAGSLTGLLVGLGALAIPGIGPIIAAGPLAAALVGAGVGAMAGGLVGAFTDLGVSEEDAPYYAEAIRRGGTIVVVRTDDATADQAASIMRRHAPIDMDEEMGRWREEGWTGFDHGDLAPDLTDVLVTEGEDSSEGELFTERDDLASANVPDLDYESRAYMTHPGAGSSALVEPAPDTDEAMLPDEERHPERSRRDRRVRIYGVDVD